MCYKQVSIRLVFNRRFIMYRRLINKSYFWHSNIPKESYTYKGYPIHITKNIY